MKLYYTVSSRQDALQAKPNLSLGGFKSSSPVSNSVFNSLFGDLSLLSLERANKEYIGLVLKNDLLQATDTIKIWLEPALNGYCKYRVAVVELSTTNEMEAIPTLYSQPMYAEFYEVNSEEESNEYLNSEEAIAALIIPYDFSKKIKYIFWMHY